MNRPPKATYAQSSDIKSRTYSEYRQDMKKKAIAELEFLPFLQRVLIQKHGDCGLIVKKHGGDAELWFGKNETHITQIPDYQAAFSSGEDFLYEFQYAENIDKLNHVDFKVSKIGKKQKGKRTAHIDREFFYVVKPHLYALITPQWVMDNGQEGVVPAWGNRTAYRVPRDNFMQILMDGGTEIKNVIATINSKNDLLHFQHGFLEKENKQFSRELQDVVDKQKLVKIMPCTLEGFYRVCHLLSYLGEKPDAPNIWMIYLLSLFNEKMKPLNFARFMFALDFLYFHCDEIKENEKTKLCESLEFIRNYILARTKNANGALAINANESPLEETRQILFSINLLEDISQCAAVIHKMQVKKTERIFDMVPDVKKTACYIEENNE